MDNAERSNRFEVIVLSVRDEYGDDFESGIIGLLADARHWCDHNGRAYADLDRKAYRRYLTDLDQPSPRERTDHDQ